MSTVQKKENKKTKKQENKAEKKKKEKKKQLNCSVSKQKLLVVAVALF